MDNQQNKSAIVIGASMAGLVTARVLSEHFEKVFLVERDPILNQPESRKGQPQTQHLHALLASGLITLQKYFPDLTDSIKTGGGIVCDAWQSMVWNCYGNYRLPFEVGKQFVFASRPFLEWQVRQRVLGSENLEVLSGYSVDQLLTDEHQQQVTGVQMTNKNSKETAISLQGDLVIDASGRGSRSGKWLKELGYSKPVESKVSCGTGYTTRIYERNPEEPNASKWFFITPEAPKEQRGGGAFPVEGNRWIVSLSGWHGEHAPKDEAGFEAFAKSLPSPDIYNIISRNKPLSNFSVYKYPYSLRRHYEKLTRFPQGYLVLGDAVCSFNPLYGQGMTSAILQAHMLDNLLQKRKGKLANIAKPYFRRISKMIDIPWQSSVLEDFRFPQTTGKKQLGTDFINAYMSHVHRTTHTDAVVSKAFFEVINMIEPPTSLFKPTIVVRVLRNMLNQRSLGTLPQPQMVEA
uniref:Uncharacterized protein n=1 Tax=Roseihalotalea indica TaxID=2867963 RepID=A0AA49GJX7_9BACT|nr:hypothetical protein K4G66_24010 [Tunicatimonas sp. TK19036]